MEKIIAFCNSCGKEFKVNEIGELDNCDKCLSADIGYMDWGVKQW